MLNSPPHILCVDDLPDTCELIAFWVAPLDYRFTTAETIAEALQLAVQHPIDLYLVETRFMDGDGEELCEKLHALTPTIPILVYTADTRAITQTRLSPRYARKYLTKPCDPDVMKQAIHELLAQKDSRSSNDS